MNILKKILLMKLLYNFFIHFPKLTTMTNFEILNTEQLQEVKGGHNEHSQRDIADEAVV